MKRIPIFLISTLFMVFIVGTPALAFSPGLDEAQQNTVVGGVVVPAVDVALFNPAASELLQKAIFQVVATGFVKF